MLGKMLFLSLLFLSSVLVSAEDFVVGKVTATNLNLRVLPSTSQTVVAKFAKGAELKIFSVKEAWCEVEAPPDSILWIAAADISPEGLILKDSFLRSGAGISYSPFSRKALKGEKFTVLERRSDWVRLSAPSGLRAWVSAEFVQFSNANIGKLSEAKVADSNNGVVNKSSLEFDFLSLPEKDAVYEGIFVSVKDANLVSYALAVKVNENYVPVCYIKSSGASLDLWKNQKVKVTGKEKWVRGWKRPLLILDKIEKSHTD